MSLSRQIFRELRPFFRMLEEPFGRSPAYWNQPGIGARSFFEDPFFASPGALRPAIDVHEQGDQYIVEAELPGVKKENVNVRIGEGGRSITIEGKVVRSSPEAHPTSTSTEATGSTSTGAEVSQPQQSDQTAITAERTFTGTSSFTRTVLLPQSVDTSKVSARLSDGVLTVTVPKAADTGSVQVNVE